MGEMKKIVVENYPVDRLPEELRHGLATGETVRVTVEAGEKSVSRPEKRLLDYLGAGSGCYSEAEAVSYIRGLRDE